MSRKRGGRRATRRKVDGNKRRMFETLTSQGRSYSQFKPGLTAAKLDPVVDKSIAGSGFDQYIDGVNRTRQADGHRAELLAQQATWMAFDELNSEYAELLDKGRFDAIRWQIVSQTDTLTVIRVVPRWEHETLKSTHRENLLWEADRSASRKHDSWVKRNPTAPPDTQVTRVRGGGGFKARKGDGAALDTQLAEYAKK